ncbi:MAG: amidohydrolase [Clostridia bacterium]|nr:amidohydrolase [Clostridia bacterium]
MKAQIFATIEKHADKMHEILDYMWANPQSGFREWKANKLLLDAYRALGYEPIEAGDIPGFYVDIDTGNPGPRIAIFSELDGLSCPNHPNADKETGIAHACGHHAQCAALYGVAAALKEVDLSSLSGSIRLLIVPAEELGEFDFRQSLKDKGIIKYFSGKQEFLRRGYLDGCDIGFMIHTGGKTHKFSVQPGCNGCIVKTAEFKGKAAHAAAGFLGVNALYAANLSLNAINALRESFYTHDYVRVHPIIRHGGDVVNIIPDKVVIENQVRAAKVGVLKRVNKRVNRATAASAAAMGANVVINDIPGYLPGNYFKPLIDAMFEAMAEVVPAENCTYNERWDASCTDMGDISQLMPAVHAVGCGAEGAGHSVDYKIVDFDSACLDSAKAQVMIVFNLLKDGAEKAKTIIEQFTPAFASKEEYFNLLDSLYINKTAVTYNGEDKAELDF